MAGTASGAGNSSEDMSSGHRCQSGEAIAEWRSSEQLENGTPSTSPPYWDSDDENDSGPKPADLYGKYTWKIEKFSHINKRELRSNAFEVGSYKWYILIYPQGCDVCNHLSLFLCVANHDKLLPGWSHFAQFTIAVVNKDPKKSKYSDTLHRFWKKEHDWGWKKFMELSKVLDGFVEEDTLIIKAQVQVIREKADRPFRCLDCQYRRELVRVYLTNVEQICRRFVEERRSKLVKLIEDKEGWSSFCDFWSDTDKAARHCMCREKTDMILKVVVKHFFIEKEVTSTLVMDSLYSGLKALEGQTKFQKNKAKLMDIEEMPAPIIRVEKDMFVLVDDVLLLLERAAMEPLPPKDDKGPQNRTKDGSSGDDSNKDSIERDERRLTELGRRTVEIFVLAHIFSKIEVAYKEAVAWKRQDELIREEAAAGPVYCKQKSKRGAVEKEKKSKKKQAKQKRNSRKVKDKVKDEKSNVTAQDKQLQETIDDDTKDFVIEEVQPVHQKSDMPEGASDVSDSVDCVAEETVHPDSEDRDASPVNWDTDTSEVLPHTEASISPSFVQNGTPDRKSPSIIDDSSSTCSTDSVPSVVANGPYRGSSFYQHKSEKSTGRGKNRRSRGVVEGPTHGCEVESHPSEDPSDSGPLNTESENHGVDEPEESEAVILLQDRIKWLEQHVVKKEEEVDSLQKKLSVKEQVDKESPKDERSLAVPSSPKSPPKSIPSPVRVRSESKNNANADPESLRKPSTHNAVQTDGASSLVNSLQSVAVSKPELKAETPKPSEKPSIRQVPSMSRPSSAPLVPAPRPTAPAVSTVQTTPPLARSVCAAGRLGPEPSSSSSSTHSSVPQSYRNVMMGNAGVSSSVYTHPQPPSSPVHRSSTYSQPSLLTSSPLFIPQSPERVNPGSFRPGFSFGTTSRDVSQHTPHWMDGSPQRDIRTRHSERSPHLNDVQSMSPHRSLQSGSQGRLSTEFPVGPSGCQIPSALADEFPHLDIINDLLDDESSMGRTASSIDAFHRPHMLNRHFSFPGDLGTSSEDSSTSSCRFKRTQSHYDASYQRTYSSLGNHYDPLLEASQSNPILYSSDQVDGVIPNHWQLAGSDISMLARINADADGYSYNMPDYANLANGVNGYSVFGPSNGH